MVGVKTLTRKCPRKLIGAPLKFRSLGDTDLTCQSLRLLLQDIQSTHHVNYDDDHRPSRRRDTSGRPSCSHGQEEDPHPWSWPATHPAKYYHNDHRGRFGDGQQEECRLDRVQQWKSESVPLSSAIFTLHLFPGVLAQEILVPRRKPQNLSCLTIFPSTSPPLVTSS